MCSLAAETNAVSDSQVKSQRPASDLRDALSDIYGLGLDDSRQFTNVENGAVAYHTAKQQVDEAMEALPKEDKAAYLEALHCCPHLVETESKVGVTPALPCLVAACASKCDQPKCE